MHINVRGHTPVKMTHNSGANGPRAVWPGANGGKEACMCLGIPMQVLETDGFTALCAGRGERRRVNVMLIEEVPPGGWLLAHLDNAVRPLDEDEVKPLNDALDAILLAARGENVDHLFADLITHGEPPGEAP